MLLCLCGWRMQNRSRELMQPENLKPGNELLLKPKTATVHTNSNLNLVLPD